MLVLYATLCCSCNNDDGYDDGYDDDDDDDNAFVSIGKFSCLLCPISNPYLYSLT